jgi:phosphatidate cytidylyltransferase
VVIIGSLLSGPYTFGALFLIIGILALHEFYALLGVPPKNVLSLTGEIGGAVIFILGILVASGILHAGFLAMFAAVPLTLFIVALYSEKNDAVLIGKILLGIIYIILPLTTASFVAFYDSGVYSHRIILGVLILIWINDTGAYVAGSLFGRHKLFPRISPKKSWEGFAGGALFTLIAAFVIRYMLQTSLLTADWMIIGLLTCVVAVYGDLTESMFKRSADKKDSGNLIPGHGGILDRFDSILFMMPVVFIYLMIR